MATTGGSGNLYYLVRLYLEIRSQADLKMGKYVSLFSLRFSLKFELVIGSTILEQFAVYLWGLENPHFLDEDFLLLLHFEYLGTFLVFMWFR